MKIIILLMKVTNINNNNISNNVCINNGNVIIINV